MSDPAEYTVGWICALPVEYVAAQEFLDKEHDKPSFVSPNDTNDYTLGKMGEHNVVIAVLPDGEYGTASAANVATNMLNTFHNIRIGLMVGIGGGVPSESHDIRLGDVVVSAPRGGEGGVFQYDFGKSIQGQSFQHTRFLNQPPTILRTAMTGIQAHYKRKGHQLMEAINSILDTNVRLRSEYEKPLPSTDRLFESGFLHDSRGCATFCASDPSKLVRRRERTKHEDNPTIHYGLIASANQLMKDALIRDRLAAEKDVLCFEMEAAGLVNTFPCLVIRGICDYSDSHKNKEWQGYAAMVAAAYAKDLLQRMPLNKIENETKIQDTLSCLQDLAESHKDLTQKQLTMQIKAAEERWTDEQEKCLQLFRLTSGHKDITYEWYKDRVETRVEGTCEWLINHANFQKWLGQDSGPLLISADPGCGKSVLAKYLIDHGILGSATICYFFFKENDQNTIRQALCALIHQLLLEIPSLIEHALEESKKNGRGLVNSTNSLWNVLERSVRDPRAGPVVIVLDALDECAETEFEDLMRHVEGQFSSELSNYTRLKYLLTSRPYEQIVCRFGTLLDSFPCIRILGEEESETISQEINFVIQNRMEKLAKLKGLSDPVRNSLVHRLLDMPHRTYLWVYLVFEHLKRESFKKTTNGVNSSITTLPTDVNEAYERILNKSTEHTTARRALSIILAASRPFKLRELNIALNVDRESKSFDDLDLEEDEDFKCRLRNICGLFVSIHQHKVYLIHQTAREFLLINSLPSIYIPSQVRWQHSFTTEKVHKVLAEICVTYIDFLNNDHLLIGGNSEENHGFDSYSAFLDYSAENWGEHFRRANIGPGDAILTPTMSICDSNSVSCRTWFSIYWKKRGRHTILKGWTSLMISSFFGHETVVRLLLDKNVDVNPKDERGYTPLFWATENGHEAIVKILLESNADLNSIDFSGQKPILRAIENGNETVVKLLLEQGADVNSLDYSGRAPLLWASRTGQETVVKLLLGKSADVDLKNWFGSTPLLYAATNGHEAVAKLLLESNADIDTRDMHHRTPLYWAARKGHEAVVKLLLEKGANMEAKGKDGVTPLGGAALHGHEAIVKQLLEKGADPSSEKDLGGLWWSDSDDD
ncbi:hypothetical protein N7501_007585 [Penicillium viridicatum]|nr:hypothetical protein N7501_007585 [Penicillium viridicatum]